MSAQTYDWSAMPRGMRAAFGVPGLVMAASFIGFGALVRGLEVGLLAGLLSTPLIWALPGQVVFVNMYAEQAGLAAIALAVTITAIRLLPMVVLVISKVRLEHGPRLPLYVLSHFIAVTLWRVAEDGIDNQTRPRRLPWLMGAGLALMSGMIVMTCAGYYLAQVLPPLLAACLMFLTPSFFFVSLFAGAKFTMDYASIALGAVIGPVVYRFYPELDLV
ncbi:MAG: AzlC family ABC transporter permease, partial [Hyphomicrobiales bacterium]